MADDTKVTSPAADDEAAEEFVKHFAEFIEKGYTIADLMNISPERMEALYSLAYQNYVTKNYEDALKVFKVLVLYDQSEQKYTMGLAATEQDMGDYVKAANTYSLACLQSGLKDPEPMYFAAICLLKAGQKEDAVVALKSLETMGREGNTNDEKFKQKGLNLLKVMENFKEL
ncbi:SycD/LcrH family type III secretion system chaperone [Succinimonas sp.]|jgi:type III secretion system low calcium response chaperone LcrH/SycD|uniref:SycD/LcrH family type III secretion system chaperone n=1 Tax=Succinimonas sp. TaxID=1936151 RepID=UPI002E85FFEA|nr:SycD/LcrH family type III secretion system chaperone [Succinimonas sp.]MEE3422406.1 SycD/LcrH family type III secretion system chaperone [Succinimonas sp.]